MSGPVINATCNTCGDVRLTSADVTLVVDHAPHYAFPCPKCGHIVAKEAPPNVIALLRTGGVRPTLVITDQPALTEDDLIAFGLALEAGNVEEIA